MAETNEIEQFQYDDDDDDDKILLISPFNNSQSLSTNQKQKTIDDFIRQVQDEKFDINVIDNVDQRIKSSNDTSIVMEKYFDEEIVYIHCPICCKSSKNINHIRNCAQKSNIAPKEVIYNLRKIKTIKRIKLKKITNCNQKNSQRTLDNTSLNRRKTLFVNDKDLKKSIFEKNISRLKIVANRISDYNENGEIPYHQQQIDNLPEFWLASFLDFQSEKYQLIEFQKFF